MTKKTDLSLMNEVQSFLNESDLGYVSFLSGYSENGQYLSIRLYKLGISIEKGHDTFFYNGYETESKRCHWYVSMNNDLFIEKGFRCYKKAIKQAILKRKKELRKELEELKNADKQLKAAS